MNAAVVPARRCRCGVQVIGGQCAHCDRPHPTRPDVCRLCARLAEEEESTT